MTSQKRIDVLAGMLAVLMCKNNESNDYHDIAIRAYEVATMTSDGKIKHDADEEENALKEKIVILCKSEKSLPEIKRAIVSKKYTSKCVISQVDKLVMEDLLKLTESISGYGRSTIKYTAA